MHEVHDQHDRKPEGELPAVPGAACGLFSATGVPVGEGKWLIIVCCSASAQCPQVPMRYVCGAYCSQLYCAVIDAYLAMMDGFQIAVISHAALKRVHESVKAFVRAYCQLCTTLEADEHAKMPATWGGSFSTGFPKVWLH